MPEEFVGEPEGLEAWLKGPEAELVARMKAQEVAEIARAIAPVGQPPEDVHPGLYRSSIEVGPPMVTGDRVGVPVIAAVPYAAKVEHTYGYHTLETAAALANDPSPTHPRRIPTSSARGPARRMAATAHGGLHSTAAVSGRHSKFAEAERLRQANAAKLVNLAASKGLGGHGANAYGRAEARYREFSNGGQRYRAVLSKARSLEARRTAQRSRRPTAGHHGTKATHGHHGVHAIGLAKWALPVWRPFHGGPRRTVERALTPGSPFQAFRHLRELATLGSAVGGASGGSSGQSGQSSQQNQQPGQRGSYGRTKGSSAGGSGAQQRRTI